MGLAHNFKELFKIHKFDIEIDPARYGVPTGGTRGVVMREFEMALDSLAIAGYAGDEITVTIRKR